MARWSDIVYLVSTTNSTNSLGDTVGGQPTERLVYANEISVSRSEFYQAQKNDLKPEIAFEVHTIDYNGEKKLKYTSKDGIKKEYNIIRTYGNDGEIVELICNRLTGG